MFSQNTQPLNEEKENIIGFHVLSDGSFIKVHNNQKIEILKGISREFIEIKGAPETHEAMKDYETIVTRITELPNQRVALAYSFFDHHRPPHLLAILDLNSKTCVATKQIDRIESLSALPDSALLVNSELICSIQDNNISMNKDQRFEDYVSRQGDRYTISDSHYIPLQDQSGFIYFTDFNKSTVKIITNEFKEKAQLQLGPNTNPNHISWMSLTPSNSSTIKQLAPISQDYFACITECSDKYFAATRSADTYRLHVVRNDLNQSYKVNLHHLYPQALIVLNNEHVAIVGQHDGKDYDKISVKVFNLKGQEVNKFVIDKAIDDHFITATPDGQLVTCSRTGQIAIHTCIPAKENLRKEIKSVLTDSNPMLMAKDLVSIVTDYAELSDDGSKKISAKPKDKSEVEKLRKETESVLTGSNILPETLAPIITGYAGFFRGNPEMPKETFEETNHPSQKPGIFSKLRSMF